MLSAHVVFSNQIELNKSNATKNETKGCREGRESQKGMFQRKRKTTVCCSGATPCIHKHEMDTLTNLSKYVYSVSLRLLNLSITLFQSTTTVKWCPETGDKICYTTVTLADIRRAQKTGVTPNAKKKQLVRIPSKQERQLRYDLAAEAIAVREAQLLPTFGGRPWTVTVKVAEPTSAVFNKQKPPLFRWFRGELELAVLPHLLEKVPEDAMVTKGKAKHEEEGTEMHIISTALSERNVSQLSWVAWNDPEYMIPTVTIRWLSPNHKTFSSRRSAEEEAARLQADQLLLDKFLFGIGTRGQLLRPTKTSKNDALKAGKLRFDRDGLWVVGQEDMWQSQRADQLEKEEMIKAEEARVRQEEEQSNKLMAAEEAEKNRDDPKPKVDTKKRPFSALTYYIHTKREELRKQRQIALDLIHPHPKMKFTLKEADEELKAEFKSLRKQQQNQWQEKAREANSANQGICLSGLDYFILIGRKDLEIQMKRDFLAAHGRQERNEDASTATIGDVLHNAGEDEEKKDDSLMLIPNSSGSELDEDSPVKPQPKPEFNPCVVLTKLRHQWFSLSEECRGQWTKKALEYNVAETAMRNEQMNVPAALKGNTDGLALELSKAIDFVMLTSTLKKTEIIFSKVEAEETIMYGDSRIPIITASPARLHIREEPNPVESELLLEAVPSSTPAEAHSTNPKRRRRALSKCPPRRFGVSDHWRMNNDEIDMCYEAAMDHYDKVMYTVKARALFSELADGFDVLRERGRGRYDMELPAFESPAFSFLTSLDAAAWMPLVRQILGDDVTLIHKGVFLSMPGAEHQVYHQDGPHLNSKVQRPCHAVNVFIPLVDLNARNGPTEFSLGSHILGFEDYNKANVYMPQVPAGTPVMFDYRLGHRGLANSGNECRPIVYCTYAASKDGKEFRDSVNFSTKRYHKIGDLIEKPLSREERAKKRKIQLEEKECNELLRSAQVGHGGNVNLDPPGEVFERHVKVEPDVIINELPLSEKEHNGVVCSGPGENVAQVNDQESQLSHAVPTGLSGYSEAILPSSPEEPSTGISSTISSSYGEIVTNTLAFYSRTAVTDRE